MFSYFDHVANPIRWANYLKSWSYSLLEANYYLFLINYFSSLPISIAYFEDANYQLSIH